MSMVTSLLFIETYVYARKKHPFASCPVAKHPNAANLRLQIYDKNQWTFFNDTARASNLAPNLGSFAKVSAPVKKYNSLVTYFSIFEIVSPIGVIACVYQCT